MDDTRLPLVKEISDFFKSIENSGHDLFSALEVVLDEEYDKTLIDSCCDLKLENIKLEEAIRLCHERFEAEKDFVRIGKATEKVFKETDIAMFLSYWTEDGEEYVDENNSIKFDSVEDLLEWYEREEN